ncbi:hypothetical protein M2323_001738 [Rhodoblastus acidophilus]|nr:hypothetical protein [Rhodoblastus acidophilus]MCW2332821.1 hypothetical protein [Rhodoblastus acidophilus]
MPKQESENEMRGLDKSEKFAPLTFHVKLFRAKIRIKNDLIPGKPAPPLRPAARNQKVVYAKTDVF